MKKSYDLLCVAQQRWKKTIRIMKLTVGLILFTLFTASAVSSYSQTARISLNMNNATIVDIFREIERNSEFGFFFKSEELNLENKKSIRVSDATIDEVLKKVLDENCTYKIVDKNIVVTIENPIATMQQGKKVTGKISDKSGGSLPGVSVVVKGTTNGVITDAGGNYTISGVPDNATLQFMFVGMKTQEVVVGSKGTINIVLEEENIGIEEVVVVGYGTVKKSDITGALVSVSEKTMKERPVQNAVQAIQGKVAGVDIVSNVRPGEVASVTIRGTRSISATNSPLYVVDGIILMGSLNDINPNDISSMEILKDASATAIYGARGANGVVLITTKQGKKGKLSVNYDMTTSFDNIHSTTDWAGSGEAMDRMRLAEINGGTYKLGTTSLSYPDPQADINKFGNSDVTTINAIRSGYEWNDPGTFSSVKTRAATPEEIAKGYPAQVPLYNPGNIPSTDWQDILTRTGITQNHLLSLSAGNETSRLYISLGYYDNNGTQKNQEYSRFTTKINGDITPVKWMVVGASINASMTSQQYGVINRSGSATGPQDAYGMALGQYRMAQPYDANGDMILYPGNNKSGPTWNPLIDMENSDDDRRSVNINANLYAEIKFTPWLKYRMNFGSGFRYQRNGAWQGSQSTLRRTATPQTSAASYSTSDNFQYMLENLLYFDKTYDQHTFGATLLQSVQKNRTESANMSASKIIYDSSQWYNLGANLNGNPDSYGTGFTENSLMSYMVRLNYSFKNKYLFTATGRNDGASVLAPGHKWSFFPSGAVAWKMHEESFLKPVSWINELKLRLGYGVVGNSAVGAYSTSGPLTQYKYAFGDIAAIGYNPYNMPNPDMQWETTAQTNLGIDFSVLKSRLSGTIELYHSNTDNILMDRSIPAIVGFPFITGNIGKMMNKGIELSLSSINVQSDQFRWTTDFNWTANHEEIVELVNGKEDMKGNNWYIGYPLQVFRTYEVDGLWQDTPEDKAEIAKWSANGYNFAPGQYKPVEQGTPNNKLEDNDKVIRGTVRPKWIAGMTNTFNYKDFELSFMVYSRVGQKYFSSLQPGGSGGGSFVGYVRSESSGNFWSPTNTGAKWPQPTTNPKASNADINRAMFINDGSFVAVRNISLAYNFPAKILEKCHIKSFQLYGQMLNPFLWGGDVVKAGINPDDTNGWTNVNSVGDPTGGSNNNTMVIKSYVLGVRIGL
jgi:TonB-linked SusC/RagA family outer membrane protein